MGKEKLKTKSWSGNIGKDVGDGSIIFEMIARETGCED
jgi:hypothetical protein